MLILYAFNFFISVGAISGIALATGMLLMVSVPHTALISAKRIIFENAKEARKGLRIKNQEELITLGKITTLILETKGIATTGIQTAKKFFVDDLEFGVSGEGQELKGEFSNKPVDLHLLLKAGLLTSNAKLDKEDVPVGNPIDSAQSMMS